MKQLKLNVEKLNNLYFRLNGMYDGAIMSLLGNGVMSEEVTLLDEELNLDYLSSFLEALDEDVIKKVNHGLDCDSYLYSEEKNRFSKLEADKLFNESMSFNVSFLKELNELEEKIYSEDSNVLNLGILCEEMRSVVDQINESLYIIDRECKVVCDSSVESGL